MQMINVQLDEKKMFGPPTPPMEPHDSAFFARLYASVTGPMPTFGSPLPTRDGRPVPKVIGDAQDLLDRTAHVRKPKERMMQFFARTGLGAAQIRTMTRDEIAHFVNCVSHNERGYGDQAHFEPRVMPKLLLLDI
jgi:hypothetical protein